MASSNAPVSAETLIQSNSMLTQLARSRARDGSPTLEELVRQSLEPKVQEWLNANLKDIVERLVQQEIERIRQRTE
jgi:cell pole-organizing protein PopZ